MNNEPIRVLPAEFAAMLARHREFDGLAEALSSTESAVSVRANRSKGIVPPAGADLVPWCDAGFYLAERPAFTFDPALHQGLYYVQDASSMALSRVVADLAKTFAPGPLAYLDACAAPGGKTTAAIDALPAGSLVVANEFDPKRAAVLVENIERWGSPDVIVTQGDTARLAALGETFDIVAADVPCSGEGMMRKEPAAIAQWSPGLVASCAALQREIVDNVWQTLRPGGYLIYSTCTFNRQEDEQNLAWIVETYGAEPIDTRLADMPGVIAGIDTPYPCARFLPGNVRGEGLFVAVVRKPLDAAAKKPASAKSRGKASKSSPDQQIAREASAWLNREMRLTLLPDGRLTAISPVHAALADRIAAATRVLICGLHVADIVTGAKKSSVTPTHALALSTALAADAFPRVDIPYADAIAYLRRDTPAGQPSAPRGILLLTHASRPLGLIKNLGNRANTLLPASRRILSTSMPQTPPVVL